MTRDVPKPPKDHEVTPESVYFNRRTFLKAGAIAATAAATGVVYARLNGQPAKTKQTAALAGLEAGPTTGPAAYPPDVVAAFHTDQKPTPYQTVTHYNNFYEFGTSKSDPAQNAGDFKTAGWKVQVDGLCSNPTTFDLDDLMKVSRPQERVYRFRCVEAWSMVVPWAGYSLQRLLDKVKPLSGAKYVAFTTLMDPKMFPGQKTDVLQWPYVEGLRMDEAMNPLTLLTTGLYGRELPAQDGAPVRLIIPWKYGFKGIKSIVKISLVAEQPPTSWQRYAPAEYGFYANVNPNHPHPRWSQATERLLGVGEQPTQMFNGYGEQVASLYKGMDLDKDF